MPGISFNNIAADIRVPGQYVEIDSSRAQRGTAGRTQRTLLLGSHTAAVGLTQVFSTGDAERRWGKSSMLTRMVKSWVAGGGTGELWVQGLPDDGAGTAATGTATFTGPATEAGTVYGLIAGQRVVSAVANGDSATTIATAFVAAVTAVPDLPVTAANVAGVVTFTVRNGFKGVVGADIDLSFNYNAGERLPGGVGVTVVAMSGGGTNPAISGAIAGLGDQRFDAIVMPYTDTTNLTTLETELASRWAPPRMIEGEGYIPSSGTVGSLASFGTSRNSPFMECFGIYKCPNPGWERIATWAAVVESSANIDPARGFEGLPLPGLLPPPPSNRFMGSEQETLLRDGISTAKVEGGVLVVQRAITMYQTAAGGVIDTAYLNLNTVKTTAYFRYSLRARMALKFPRHKLVDDGNPIAPGQAVVSPKVIRAEEIALASEWVTAGLMENLDQFKRDLVTQRSATDPDRIDSLLAPDVVNQFRIFAGQIQFRL